MIVHADSRASSARKIPLHYPRIYWRTVARIAPSETRGGNWIQMQFRGEEKPSKHRFKALRVDKTYLCASDTSKVGSFGVSQPLEIAG